MWLLLVAKGFCFTVPANIKLLWSDSCQRKLSTSWTIETLANLWGKVSSAADWQFPIDKKDTIVCLPHHLLTALLSAKMYYTILDKHSYILWAPFDISLNAIIAGMRLGTLQLYMHLLHGVKALNKPRHGHVYSMTIYSIFTKCYRKKVWYLNTII